MQPYSRDLRQRIVDCYDRGEGSIRRLAERFKVTPDCVRRLLKHYRETGSVEPKPHAGGAEPQLREEHLEVLRQLVAEKNDATLADLSE